MCPKAHSLGDEVVSLKSGRLACLLPYLLALML